jgi:hypothetical protein
MARKHLILLTGLLTLSLMASCTASKGEDLASEGALYTAAVQTAAAELAHQHASQPPAPVETPLSPASEGSPSSQDPSSWTVYLDEGWGFSLSYPGNWTYVEVDLTDPDWPIPEGLKRQLMLMPQDVKDKMDARTGPPDPDAPPLVPSILLEVNYGSLEQYRVSHVEPDAVEDLVINDLPAVLEYCGYGTLCYVIQAPGDAYLRITLTDLISGFPERAAADPEMVALIRNVIDTFAFAPDLAAPGQADEPLVSLPEEMPAALPQPLATPQPEAVAHGRSLYSDDFSTRRGWFSYEGEQYTLEYKDGGYRVYNNLLGDMVWSIRQIERSDVLIQADASILAGPQDGYFGLICRYSDENNFYALVAGKDGFYGIAKVERGEFAFLEKGYLPEHLASRMIGSEEHRIGAECSGESLSLFIDGYQAVQVQDETFSTGYFGLLSGTVLNPGMDVLFDNFAVYAPLTEAIQ